VAKKRKKIRIPLRKNIQRKSRQKDFTRTHHDDHQATEDLSSGERISGKGQLSRHRTVIGDVCDDSHDFVRDIDVSKCRQGFIIQAIGLNSVVQTDSGEQYLCTIRRLVRSISRDERNAVVVGDRVWFRPSDDETGVIEQVLPRESALSRYSQNREQVLIANVDQAVIVISADEPPLKPHLIDRFLISCEKGGVTAVICINKLDLVTERDLQSLFGIYAQLGYQLVLTSAAQLIGVEKLKSILMQRHSVITGQSGVGKSTLLNVVSPGLQLPTGKVSEGSSKGQHTTRKAELFPLAFGGWVADTPGIRQLQLWDVTAEEVEAYFIEFRPWVTRCKFPDCSHVHESSCGVRNAVEAGMISRMRYDSYLKMISE